MSLANLRITGKDLDDLTGLSVSDLSVGLAIRLSALRQPQRLLSWLTTEIFTLGVILIFTLPTTLLLGRSFGLSNDSTTSLIIIVLIGVGLAMAIALGWFIYRWQQTRLLKTLMALLDEVDKHNEVIEAVEVLDQLSNIDQSQVSLTNRDSVLEALHATRQSLICALSTDRILRKNRKFIARRQELFANIEQSLTTLRSLHVNHAANEYGQLLDDAFQIGLSVHEELQQRYEDSR